MNSKQKTKRNHSILKRIKKELYPGQAVKVNSYTKRYVYGPLKGMGQEDLQRLVNMGILDCSPVEDKNGFIELQTLLVWLK